MSLILLVENEEKAIVQDGFKHFLLKNEFTVCVALIGHGSNGHCFKEEGSVCAMTRMSMHAYGSCAGCLGLHINAVLPILT